MLLVPRLKWAGMILVVTGYAVIANYTNQSTQHDVLGVLVAIAPIVLAIIFSMWQSRLWAFWQRAGLCALVIIGCVVLSLIWPQLKRHYDWIYWLEHESLQLILFFTFARTLTGKSVPLCTQFAQTMHGELTSAHERYARKATVAWALFFGIIIMISSTLFFMYPIGVWSIFANFIYLPLVILMFIVEFVVRKHLLPDAAGTRFMDAINAFQNRAKS